MIEIKHSIFDFDRSWWNQLVPNNHPFLKYEFFQALEESQCIGASAGWLPFYLYNNDAVLPVYLKSHSYGEFIFDWSWAQAYEQVGLSYYPKITAAIPHTPVSAPKFITKAKIDYSEFFDELKKLGKQYQSSSSHFLFTTKNEASQLEQAQYLRRHSVQYHWHNQNFECFDDFLATLRKDKRKAFKKERQSIQKSDLDIIEKTGTEISASDAELMAQLYFNTIDKKWSQAYLNQSFFQRWFELLKDQMVLFQAKRNDQIIAAAIHLRSDDTLYGRYWGSLEDIPYLHFELCYYRAIDYAITHKMPYVEAGAQGEHKLMRGFYPTIITSHHDIAHPGFKTAIADFLQRERTAIDQAMPQFEALLPYKRS